jgi:hypothetical protein
VARLAAAFAFRRMRCVLVGLVVAACAAHAYPAAAQDVAQPDASVGASLRNLASRAGVVFVGRVTAIGRAGGVVCVQFAVEQTVAGSVVSTYTLREWAGLWPPGQARYVLGQRVLIFLNPANGAGLSTPVDGMEGVLPVMVQGASSPELVDVRRVATRVQREVGSSLPGTESGAILLSDAAATIAGWRQPVWQEPALQSIPGAYVAAKPVARGTALRAPAATSEGSGLKDLQPPAGTANGVGLSVKAPPPAPEPQARGQLQ